MRINNIVILAQLFEKLAINSAYIDLDDAKDFIENVEPDFAYIKTKLEDVYVDLRSADFESATWSVNHILNEISGFFKKLKRVTNIDCVPPDFENDGTLLSKKNFNHPYSDDPEEYFKYAEEFDKLEALLKESRKRFDENELNKIKNIMNSSVVDNEFVHVEFIIELLNMLSNALEPLREFFVEFKLPNFAQFLTAGLLMINKVSSTIDMVIDKRDQEEEMKSLLGLMEPEDRENPEMIDLALQGKYF